MCTYKASTTRHPCGIPVILILSPSNCRVAVQLSAPIDIPTFSPVESAVVQRIEIFGNCPKIHDNSKAVLCVAQREKLKSKQLACHKATYRMKILPGEFHLQMLLKHRKVKQAGIWWKDTESLFS